MPIGSHQFLSGLAVRWYTARRGLHSGPLPTLQEGCFLKSFGAVHTSSSGVTQQGRQTHGPTCRRCLLSLQAWASSPMRSLLSASVCLLLLSGLTVSKKKSAGFSKGGHVKPWLAKNCACRDILSSCACQADCCPLQPDWQPNQQRNNIGRNICCINKPILSMRREALTASWAGPQYMTQPSLSSSRLVNMAKMELRGWWMVLSRHRSVWARALRLLTSVKAWKASRPAA